jgi:hypothetical protein
MPIQNNPWYGANTGTDVRRGLQNIADMFAPPSAGDIAAYAEARDRNASAKATDEQSARLRALDDYARQQAGFSKEQWDRMSVAAGRGTIANGYYGVDTDAATTRRGQDITADTALANNAADNKRMTVTSLFGALNPGQVRPALPASIASGFGLPAIDEARGLPQAETYDQVKGAILRAQQPSLTQQQLTALVMGNTPVENIVGAAGKPETVYRTDAVGQQPAFAPNKEIVTNDGFGQPPADMAWARNPDGSVKLDDRGVPTALPIGGTKTALAVEAADESAAARQQNVDTKGGVVVQDINRAIDQISSNPMMTTGVGSQATSWIGGVPAQAVSSLLDTIRSNTGFDQLQQMREASPTGGALGPVSDTENKLLQSVLGSIDPKQPAPQLMDNLKRLKNIYLDVIHGPGNGPPREKLSFPSQWDQYAAPAAAPAVEVQAGETLPPGVTEDDVQFTAKKYGLTRQQVLQRLGAH